MKLVRSLIAALLCILMVFTMGVSAFAYTDVDLTDVSLPYVEFVDRLGIIPSTWTGDFKPDQYLTRADALVAVYKMLYGEGIDSSIYTDTNSDFVESGETGDIEFYSLIKSYLIWGVDNFLVTANVENAKFHPGDAITANEFMTLLAKVLRLVENPESAVYPDDYTSAVSAIVGDIEAGDAPVTREQAAVAIANAVLSADGELVELGVYTDFEGKPLDSLAVDIYNMETIDLVIRATAKRPLGYTIKNDVLLSNGADIEMEEDMSDYVGYGISVTYRDKDGSKTFTEDEEILTYSINSTISATAPLENMSVTEGNLISITTDSASMGISPQTYIYLNDEPWPIGDSKYDLVSMAGAIDAQGTKITNRSNLRFKCMATSSEDFYYSTVFATESKPGKILGASRSYYFIFDYYYAGTPDEIRAVRAADCEISAPVAVGDFVNFYESNGVCYITPGTTKLSGVSGETDGTYHLTDGTETAKHVFFVAGNVPLELSPDDNHPTELYQFVLTDSPTPQIITWEPVRKNYKQYAVDAIAEAEENTYKINAHVLGTGEAAELTVPYANVESSTEIVAGDVIDVSEGGDEAETVYYVHKTADKTLTLTVADDDSFIDVETQQKYYKGANFTVNGADYPKEGTFTATVKLDIANTIVSLTVAA